jgi:DNA gyrase inhibitor GyrI
MNNEHDGTVRGAVPQLIAGGDPTADVNEAIRNDELAQETAHHVLVGEVDEVQTTVIAGGNYGTVRVVETSEPYDPDNPDS